MHFIKLGIICLIFSIAITLGEEIETTTQNNEIVGFGGLALARLTAKAARVKAKAKMALILAKVKAKKLNPWLLSETPAAFMPENNETQDDPIVGNPDYLPDFSQKKIPVLQLIGPINNEESNATIEDIVGKPLIIDVPPFRRQKDDEIFREKRSNQQEVLPTTLWSDESLFGSSSVSHHISKKDKRHAPLLHLLTNPNAKLDVPKTMENIGTVAKNSLEDKKAPMYHVRNMLGSAKSAMLSAMRVPPQDLIIPSQYKIVDANKLASLQKLKEIQDDNNNFNIPPEAPVVGQPQKKMTLLERARQMYQEKLAKRQSLNGPPVISKQVKDIRDNRILKAANPSSVPPKNDIFMSTFQKIGSVLRESIISAQETLQHMGDVAHSARKAMSTARFSAPRVILPYTRTPALFSRSNFAGDKVDTPTDKVMLLTPKLLDIKKDELSNGLIESNSEFVSTGEIMDALGMSNPEKEDFSLRKIVLHNPLKPNTASLMSRSNFEEDNPGEIPTDDDPKYYLISDTIDPEKEDVQDTLETLDEVKEMVGAKNLKELVQKIRNDLTSSALARKAEMKERMANSEMVASPNQQNNDDEVSNIIEDAKSKIKTLKEANKNALNLLKNLKKEDGVQDTAQKNEISDKKEQVDNFIKNMFLNKYKNLLEDDVDGDQKRDVEENAIIDENIRDVFGEPPNDEIVGAGLPLTQNLLKPFMGLPSKDELKDFLVSNGDDVSILEQDQEQAQDETVGAVNQKVVKKLGWDLNGVKPEAIVDSQGNVYKLADGEDGNEEEYARLSPTIPKHLLKPYMGKMKKKRITGTSYYGLYPENSK